MLTKEQERFINKCAITVGSQPYSEVLRLIDIIKELNDKKVDSTEELESRVYALENKIFMYNAEGESLARYIMRLENKYAKLADRLDAAFATNET